MGILIGGEELHNNHHAFASSAKLSPTWWELDIGWLYIRLLRRLPLARVARSQLGRCLEAVSRFEQRLQDVRRRSAVSSERLLQPLQGWRRQGEASGPRPCKTLPAGCRAVSMRSARPPV